MKEIGRIKERQNEKCKNWTRTSEISAGLLEEDRIPAAWYRLHVF